MFNMVVYEKNNGKTTALDFMEELPAKYRSKILKKTGTPERAGK